MSVINLSEISRVYGFGDASTLALDSVSLDIQKGEFVAVMGPSGSGKSTLMNVIGMLDTPSHGTFKLDGRIVSHVSGRKRAKLRRDKVGFVFQSFNLLPRLNVVENVALPLTYKGISHVKRMERAAKMLENVDLGERQYYMPNQLSGGQTQRVAVARALVNKPSIVLADEPTGNLDTATSIKIMELLKEIHEAGNTIIMVTHNPELAEYAERFILLRDGAVEADTKDYKEMLGMVIKSNRKAKADAVKEVQRDKEAKRDKEELATEEASQEKAIEKKVVKKETTKESPKKKTEDKKAVKEQEDEDSLVRRSKKSKKNRKSKKKGKKR